MNINNDKIILLNGVKLCGKGVAVSRLLENSKGVWISAECKGRLHELTQLFFDITPKRYWEIYNDRSLKEVPLEEFKIVLTPNEYLQLKNIVSTSFGLVDFTNGCNPVVLLSVRQAMIYVSEVIIKPRMGQDYFGKARVNQIKNHGLTKPFDTCLNRPPIVWYDDSAGFPDEIPPLFEYFNEDQILLLRIHRGDDDFDGDSRSFLPDGLIKNTVDIDNNGTLEEYLSKVEEVVKEFVNA